jgi:hypothetical protein
MKRPSPSMTVALLALFVALAGTATAATVLINSSSQIKDGAIKRQDIAMNTLDSARVKDNTLTAKDLAKSVRGSMGAPETVEAFRKTGPEGINDGANAVVAELKQLAPGAYAIFAKTTIFAPSEQEGLLQEGRAASAFCQLDADGNVDDARALLGGPGANAPNTLNMQITRTLAKPTDIQLRCVTEGGSWRAADTSIIAMRISGAQRQDATP